MRNDNTAEVGIAIRRSPFSVKGALAVERLEFPVEAGAEVAQTDLSTLLPQVIDKVLGKISKPKKGEMVARILRSRVSELMPNVGVVAFSRLDPDLVADVVLGCVAIAADGGAAERHALHVEPGVVHM